MNKLKFSKILILVASFGIASQALGQLLPGAGGVPMPVLLPSELNVPEMKGITDLGFVAASMDLEGTGNSILAGELTDTLPSLLGSGGAVLSLAQAVGLPLVELLVPAFGQLQDDPAGIVDYFLSGGVLLADIIFISDIPLVSEPLLLPF
ncbi:hypothetical protein [Zhongshania sp.]|uniref:hypothetical protein n=1 Tax=Zhongshania sp. TaxID=1971902 RepID=UPI003564D7F7